MYCSKCGARQPDEANFCSSCGSSVLPRPDERYDAPPPIPPPPHPAHPPQPPTAKASDTTALQVDRGIGTKWLRFWTYVNLPLTGGLGVLVGIALLSQAFWLGAALVLVSLLYLAAAFGLHKRRHWGWQLNWVTIAINALNGIIPNSLESFSDPLEARVLGEMAVRAVVVLLIWVLPNLIYWRKRRSLFT